LEDLPGFGVLGLLFAFADFEVFLLLPSCFEGLTFSLFGDFGELAVSADLAALAFVDFTD
jgi:hypothetical protein